MVGFCSMVAGVGCENFGTAGLRVGTWAGCSWVSDGLTMVVLGAWSRLFGSSSLLDFEGSFSYMGLRGPVLTAEPARFTGDGETLIFWLVDVATTVFLTRLIAPDSKL